MKNNIFHRWHLVHYDFCRGFPRIFRRLPRISAGFSGDSPAFSVPCPLPLAICGHLFSGRVVWTLLCELWDSCLLITKDYLEPGNLAGGGGPILKNAPCFLHFLRPFSGGERLFSFSGASGAFSGFLRSLSPAFSGASFVSPRHSPVVFR